MMRNSQIYFILIALCFLIYANSLNNEFVSDDIPSIINNPSISSPLRSWTDPATFLNSLNYLIAKFNPFTYHLTNILLHSLNTILVFFFLHLFFKTEASFLGACLFAAHPIHSEAVTWVSGKPYIITSLFILGAYLLYQLATGKEKAKRIKIIYYLLSLLVFFYYVWRNFSFYSLFPLFLVLSDVTFGKWRRMWKWWLPFLAIVILRIITARGVILDRAAQLAKDIGGPVAWTNPLFNFTYSFFSHLWLLLWPAKLTLYHEPAVISLFALRTGIIVLVFLFISLPFIFKEARELFLALGIFVLFLAPTYSPVSVSWLVAERYLYFPSVALSIFLAFFFERLTLKSKFNADTRKSNADIRRFYIRDHLRAICENLRSKESFQKLFMLIIAALAIRTVARNEDWKAPNRFWRQTVSVSINSHRAHNNMGDIYSQEGNIDGAIREFKKAVELAPNYADGYHNLATTYSRAGNTDEAVKFYEKAIFSNPDLFESRLNLGVIYLNKGKQDLAKVHLARAAELRPEDAAARAALDIAMNKKQ